MKIFILSDLHSTHTQRWVKSLSERGCHIFVFGLLDCDTSFYKNLSNVEIFNYGFTFHHNSVYSRWIMGKVLYFKSLKTIKQKIAEFKPDILHAHYASSYGLLGALTNFHPYVVSVWGSDVYEYPQAGCIYKRLLVRTLKKADKILSTSHIMAKQTQKYTDKDILITPFGVNTSLFKKIQVEKDESFIVGNVKTLSPKYGIDYLIKAFHLLVQNNPTKKIRLMIIGDGPNREEYEQLTHTLGIDDKVQFLGKVQNDKLPDYYNLFSVAVSVSDSESFGVVAVEAMSCECPVVTSDADGFTEVVDDGVTGFIVPKRNAVETSNAIQKFIDDPSLINTMGKAGRMRVLQLFDWDNNVQTMMDIYHKILNV